MGIMGGGTIWEGETFRWGVVRGGEGREGREGREGGVLL